MEEVSIVKQYGLHTTSVPIPPNVAAAENEDQQNDSTKLDHPMGDGKNFENDNEEDSDFDVLFLRNDERQATGAHDLQYGDSNMKEIGIANCNEDGKISPLASVVEGGSDDGKISPPSSAVQGGIDKKPSKGYKYFDIYICLAISAAVVGLAGAVLGITMTKEEVPKSIPYHLGIREYVARIVGNDIFDGRNNAYNKALDWIVFDDPAVTTPDNPKFFQRYLLAYFYFATSVKKPWNSGCAPAADLDVSCNVEITDSLVPLIKKIEKSKRWLSSVDECTWAGISCDKSSQIISIDLSGNGMTGTFPEGIFYLPYLQRLWLKFGELEGPLPELLWKQKYFHSISLESNAFIGTIPDAWFETRSFVAVNLASNQISGTISKKLWKLKDVKIIALDDNLLKATIPNEIGKLMNIVELSASMNDLNGTIPRNVGKLPYVFSLDFSQNKVSGSIPKEIGMCRNLESIDLHDNLITGPIPDNFWNLTLLYRLSLGKNELNGTISGRITKLSRLSLLSIQDNQFTGNLPARLGLTDVVWIEASGNNFTGTVPDQICDLVGSGRLEGLELDCAAPPEGGTPEVFCPCCTLCCAPNGTECYPTSRR